MSRKQPRFVFQPLACIRQMGIQRQPDGTVTYTFAAQVSKELAPVTITLRVTVGGEVQAQAWFDEAMHTSLEVSSPLLEEEMAGKQACITTNATVQNGDERNLRTGQKCRQKDDLVPLQARFEKAMRASLDGSVAANIKGIEGSMTSPSTIPLEPELSKTASQEIPASRTRRKIHAHFDGQDQENKEVQA